MSKAKRLLSLILALTMVFALFAGVTASAEDGDKEDDTIPTSAVDIDEFAEVATDSPEWEAITVLNKAGIIDGRSTGKFDPTAKVTRAEAAAMIARAALSRKLADNLPTTARTAFSDIDEANTFAAGAIGYLNQEGAINGYTDGTYHPSDEITIVAVMKILLGVLGYGKNGEFTNAMWDTNAITHAAKTGLNANIENSYEGAATRQDVAMLIFNALSISPVYYTTANGYTRTKPQAAEEKKFLYEVNNLRRAQTEDGQLTDEVTHEYVTPYGFLYYRWEIASTRTKITDWKKDIANEQVLKDFVIDPNKTYAAIFTPYVYDGLTHADANGSFIEKAFLNGAKYETTTYTNPSRSDDTKTFKPYMGMFTNLNGATVYGCDQRLSGEGYYNPITGGMVYEGKTYGEYDTYEFDGRVDKLVIKFEMYGEVSKVATSNGLTTYTIASPKWPVGVETYSPLFTAGKVTVNDVTKSDDLYQNDLTITKYGPSGLFAKGDKVKITPALVANTQIGTYVTGSVLAKDQYSTFQVKNYSGYGAYTPIDVQKADIVSARVSSYGYTKSTTTDDNKTGFNYNYAVFNSKNNFINFSYLTHLYDVTTKDTINTLSIVLDSNGFVLHGISADKVSSQYAFIATVVETYGSAKEGAFLSDIVASGTTTPVRQSEVTIWQWDYVGWDIEVPSNPVRRNNVVTAAAGHVVKYNESDALLINYAPGSAKIVGRNPSVGDISSLAEVEAGAIYVHYSSSGVASYQTRSEFQEDLAENDLCFVYTDYDDGGRNRLVAIVAFAKGSNGYALTDAFKLGTSAGFSHEAYYAIPTTIPTLDPIVDTTQLYTFGGGWYRYYDRRVGEYVITNTAYGTPATYTFTGNWGNYYASNSTLGSRTSYDTFYRSAKSNTAIVLTGIPYLIGYQYDVLRYAAAPTVNMVVGTATTPVILDLNGYELTVASNKTLTVSAGSYIINGTITLADDSALVLEDVDQLVGVSTTGFAALAGTGSSKVALKGRLGHFTVDVKSINTTALTPTNIALYPLLKAIIANGVDLKLTVAQWAAIQNIAVPTQIQTGWAADGTTPTYTNVTSSTVITATVKVTGSVLGFEDVVAIVDVTSVTPTPTPSATPTPTPSPTPAANDATVNDFTTGITGEDNLNIGTAASGAATITIEVPFGTTLADMNAATASATATNSNATVGTIAAWTAGTAPVDFTTTFTVTAEDTTTQIVYTVEATVASAATPTPSPSASPSTSASVTASAAPNTTAIPYSIDFTMPATTQANDYVEVKIGFVTVTSQPGATPAPGVATIVAGQSYMLAAGWSATSSGSTVTFEYAPTPLATPAATPVVKTYLYGAEQDLTVTKVGAHAAETVFELPASVAVGKNFILTVSDDSNSPYTYSVTNTEYSGWSISARGNLLAVLIGTGTDWTFTGNSDGTISAEYNGSASTVPTITLKYDGTTCASTSVSADSNCTSPGDYKYEVTIPTLADGDRLTLDSTTYTVNGLDDGTLTQIGNVSAAAAAAGWSASSPASMKVTYVGSAAPTAKYQPVTVTTLTGSETAFEDASNYKMTFTFSGLTTLADGNTLTFSKDGTTANEVVWTCASDGSGDIDISSTGMLTLMTQIVSKISAAAGSGYTVAQGTGTSVVLTYATAGSDPTDDATLAIA